MNCANHPDIAAAAYCRTCGKPLCSHCTRDVRGVIYCEPCLADRLEGATLPGVPPAPGVPVVVSSGPNPALAGILGAIPFGVGAVYNGQYAKGLAHLIIFCLLVFGANHAHHGPLDTIFGLGIAFFCVYQIIDAVRSAKAIQLGQPAPDPFGLSQTFGAGRVETSKVPMTAIILIALGVLLFLLNSLSFDLDQLWPLFLIALGVWLIVRRLGLLGPAYQRRDVSMVGPALLLTVGVLSLLENLHGPEWGRTWPMLLLAIGLAKLFDHRNTVQYSSQPPTPGPADNLPSGTQPPASSDTEVKNG